MKSLCILTCGLTLILVDIAIGSTCPTGYYAIPVETNRVDDYQFSNCGGLERVLIHEDIEYVGTNAFSGCGNLWRVEMDDNDRLTTLSEGAFLGCSSLVEIWWGDVLQGIGYRTFKGCSSLPELNIPNTVAYIGESAFSSCVSLTNIVWGNSLLNIGENAFELCHGLKTLDIPNNVQNISKGAFVDCTGLTCLTVGSGVGSIGLYGFAYCTSLTDITFLGATAPTLDPGVFEGLPSGATVVYPLGATGYSNPFGGIPSIGLAWAVSNGGVTITDCDTSITGELIIPEMIECLPVVSIGDSAFAYCTGIVSVDIPNTVTNIGIQAFQNCSSLQRVEIPDGVTKIGNWAFSDCSSLIDVIIGSGVTIIDSEAFSASSKLNCIVFQGDQPPSIAPDAFEGIAENGVVTYPQGASAYTNLNAISDLLLFEEKSGVKVCGAIGKVLKVEDAHVLRNGTTNSISKNDPVFEKDSIKTAQGGIVRIIYYDKTSLTIGPKTLLEIVKVPPEKASVVNLLTGLVRVFVVKKNVNGDVKFKVKTRTAVMGDRGTIFDASYYEADGMATSTCSVVTGLVEFVEIDTGSTTNLGVGQSDAVISAVSSPSITINAPGSGSVSLDGIPIDIFPFTTNGIQGQDFTLQVIPDAGWSHHGWSGTSSHGGTNHIVFLNGETAVTATFTLDPTVATNLFNTVVANAGLTGADAEIDASPFSDGIPNLVKYASNMDLSGPDDQRLSSEAIGAAGLPVPIVSNSGSNSTFQLKYLRSKSGGVVYAPQVSTDLEIWESFVVPESVVDIDAEWEVVTLEQPPTIDSAAFYKVGVQLP